MTCTSCGATIADKAIVCYRCGAPTAAPARRPAPAAGRRGRGPATLGSAIAAMALGGLALVVPDDSAIQLAAGGGALAAAVATAWSWLRRR
jgi:hypothetical protein